MQTRTKFHHQSRTLHIFAVMSLSKFHYSKVIINTSIIKTNLVELFLDCGTAPAHRFLFQDFS